MHALQDSAKIAIQETVYEFRSKQSMYGATHKRRTHAMGGGGLAKSVRFVDKGEGFRI